ncbi:MAG: hypothetical protein ABL925_04215 [Methylococcales bacterium]
MIDIPPVSAPLPVLKPIKIKRDDQLDDKKQRQRKPSAQQPSPAPAKHIDEIV